MTALESPKKVRIIVYKKGLPVPVGEVWWDAEDSEVTGSTDKAVFIVGALQEQMGFTLKSEEDMLEQLPKRLVNGYMEAVVV